MTSEQGHSAPATSKEDDASEKKSALVLAIYAAVAAAIGNLAVSYLNGRNELQVETLRAEQALVLEAIKTGGDTAKAAANLRFLVEAGLLGESGTAIEDALARGSRPSLPTSSGFVEKKQPVANEMPLQSCLERLHILIPGESPTSPVSRFALRRFQTEQRLKVTGMRDQATIDRAQLICAQSERTEI